jgi:hypothetical protein
VAGEPAGDVADGGRCWWERRLGGAVLVKVVADGGVAAGVAERTDFPEQLGDVAAAFLYSLAQVGLERVQLAGVRSLPAAIDQLLPGGGAGVALHGVPSPAQMAGDRADPVPLGEQFVHHLVVPAGPLGELPGRLRLRLRLRLGLRRLFGWPGIWPSRGFGFAQAGAVRGDAPLDGLGDNRRSTRSPFNFSSNTPITAQTSHPGPHPADRRRRGSYRHEMWLWREFRDRADQ